MVVCAAVRAEACRSYDNTFPRCRPPISSRTTLGTGLARTGTNTGTPGEKNLKLFCEKEFFPRERMLLLSLLFGSCRRYASRPPSCGGPVARQCRQGRRRGEEEGSRRGGRARRGGEQDYLRRAELSRRLQSVRRTPGPGGEGQHDGWTTAV